MRQAEAVAGAVTASSVSLAWPMSPFEAVRASGDPSTLSLQAAQGVQREQKICQQPPPLLGSLPFEAHWAAPLARTTSLSSQLPPGWGGVQLFPLSFLTGLAELWGRASVTL